MSRNVTTTSKQCFPELDLRFASRFEYAENEGLVRLHSRPCQAAVNFANVLDNDFLEVRLICAGAGVLQITRQSRYVFEGG